MAVAPAKVGKGARRPVHAAKPERPLCDWTRDLRRYAWQWARCAGNGRSCRRHTRSPRTVEQHIVQDSKLLAHDLRARWQRQSYEFIAKRAGAEPRAGTVH